MYQLIIILLLTLAFGSLSINPQIGSNNTFNIPFKITYKLNENIAFHHINRLYHIKHPQQNHLHYLHQRSDITAITEISNIKYKNNLLNITFGRDFVITDNELLFSKYSPPMDQFNFGLKKNKVEYSYHIIKLNNEQLNGDDNLDYHYNRWLYYKELSIGINQRITITLSEVLLSTGENRGIEWYYLLPFGLYAAEKKHNSREADTPDNFDNDNSFFGIGINYIINQKNSFNARIIIDDFQIDSEDRSVYEDVFGFSLGLNHINQNLDLSIKYKYASPWLYTNNGLFTNYKNFDFPIGLRYPHSHFIEFALDYKFFNSKIESIIIIGEKGQQNIYTQWNATNNNINNFKFDKTLPLELYIKYNLIDKKYFIPNIILFYNWMESNKKTLVLEWEFLINE